MVRPTVRALAVAAALASRATAAEPPPPRPDLSARPPERDPLLAALEADPDLHARAVAGDAMVSGGRALVFLGGLGVLVGFIVQLQDTWAAGADQPVGASANASRRGTLVMAAGGLAVAGGIALIVGGDERRAQALRLFTARHRGAPPPCGGRAAAP